MKRLSILVLSVIILFGCYKESDHKAEKVGQYNSTVNMYVESPTIPADSFSTSRIIVTLPYDADSTKSSIQLRTDLGTFVESNSNAIQLQARQNSDSIKRIAIATLKSGTKTGVAHIQAIIQTQQKNLAVTFSNSYPDYFLFSASNLSVKPSTGSPGEVTFNTKLLKQSGFPSQGNIMSVNVLDTNNHQLGLYRLKNPYSDVGGNSQFIFVLGDSTVNSTNYTGKMFAIASTDKAPGSSITDTLILVSSK
ncbi:MAG TPA: hypothetical protein VK588_13820 [Chitinophagaceae bacterium]|nr:hypothetical protein [Chitinophagaceae bacterium]